MPPGDRPRIARRALALWITTLPLIALTSVAAIRPRVENPHGSFKEECALCHDARGWKPARVSSKFDHSKYGFPLTGAHSTSNCTGCHQNLEFKQSKFLCASCHEDTHRGEMGSDCARCHSARSFVDRAPMVRAHQLTRFPLTGSHAALDCESCHRGVAQGRMQFVGTRAECQSCHMPDYQATRSPDHRAAGMPTDCAQCHRPLNWAANGFDHDRTQFPLTGAHRTAACMQCHSDRVFAGKSTACASCHQGDYNATTSPAHASAGFPTQCQSCHSTNAWIPGTFDHNATQFPLTGAHRGATCLECHSDRVYAGKSTACVSCHQSEFDATTAPPHRSAGFPNQCQSCHTTNAWLPGTFDHNATRFPLTGAHRAANCSSCHGDNVYAGKSTQCDACHHSDYLGATNPNHSGAGFSLACQSCHGTTAWSPSTFNHDASWFPIYSGTHAGRWTQCSSCHQVATNFTSFNCLACHPHSDRAQTDAHHQGRSGYSYDSAACYRCHPRGRP